MNSGTGEGRAPGGRIAVLAAFPFPYPQGSQVFVADQARALARVGKRPTVFCYGRGSGPAPDDIETVASPAALAPRTMNSGPHWRKPLADAALLATWRRAASRARRSGRPFDWVLAHNAEAAAIALTARESGGAPVIYVAHTLLGHELSAYLPPRLARVADNIGGRIDRAIARRVDGVIALSEEARQALSPHARTEIALIPPGFDPGPPPGPEREAKACARHGLVPGRYTLYSGNVDGYQELDLLASAAARLPASADPLVVASHASASARDPEGGAGPWRRVFVRDFEEMRSLVHAARVLVAPRRRVGGFPVKLLNYMESRRPIVAFPGAAPGLEHGRSAWLVENPRGGDGIAEALTALAADPGLARALGEGARQRLEDRHPWSTIASQTADYLAHLGPRRFRAAVPRA